MSEYLDLKPKPTKTRSSSEHRCTCHRCGNIRKTSQSCRRCPQTFCLQCVSKMKKEHGDGVFIDGCPVCDRLCCCAEKNFNCNHIYHCYKKCPYSKYQVQANIAGDVEFDLNDFPANEEMSPFQLDARPLIEKSHIQMALAHESTVSVKRSTLSTLLQSDNTQARLVSCRHHSNPPQDANKKRRCLQTGLDILRPYSGRRHDIDSHQEYFPDFSLASLSSSRVPADTIINHPTNPNSAMLGTVHSCVNPVPLRTSLIYRSNFDGATSNLVEGSNNGNHNSNPGRFPACAVRIDDYHKKKKSRGEVDCSRRMIETTDTSLSTTLNQCPLNLAHSQNPSSNVAATPSISSGTIHVLQGLVGCGDNSGINMWDYPNYPFDANSVRIGSESNFTTLLMPPAICVSIGTQTEICDVREILFTANEFSMLSGLKYTPLSGPFFQQNDLDEASKLPSLKALLSGQQQEQIQQLQETSKAYNESPHSLTGFTHEISTFEMRAPGSACPSNLLLLTSDPSKLSQHYHSSVNDTVSTTLCCGKDCDVESISNHDVIRELKSPTAASSSNFLVWTPCDESVYYNANSADMSGVRLKGFYGQRNIETELQTDASSAYSPTKVLTTSVSQSNYSGPLTESPDSQNGMDGGRYHAGSIAGLQQRLFNTPMGRTITPNSSFDPAAFSPDFQWINECQGLDPSVALGDDDSDLSNKYRRLVAPTQASGVRRNSNHSSPSVMTASEYTHISSGSLSQSQRDNRRLPDMIRLDEQFENASMEAGSKTNQLPRSTIDDISRVGDGASCEHIMVYGYDTNDIHSSQQTLLSQLPINAPSQGPSCASQWSNLYAYHQVQGQNSRIIDISIYQTEAMIAQELQLDVRANENLINTITATEGILEDTAQRTKMGSTEAEVALYLMRFSATSTCSDLRRNCTGPLESTLSISSQHEAQVHAQAKFFNSNSFGHGSDPLEFHELEVKLS